MNRYFDIDTPRARPPEQAYARVDQVEISDTEDGSFVTIGLDAVDAQWPEFTAGPFSLDPSEKDTWGLKSFWEARFSGHPPGPPFEEFDPFDELPMYQIELSLPRQHRLVETLLGEPLQWWELQFGYTGEIEVDVFSGLFAEPGTSMLQSVDRSAHAGALNQMFDMDLWPDATDAELHTALHARAKCDIEQLIMLDIGQGSAAAIVCKHGYPKYYFDTGCGVYRNAKTNPSTIRFCVCNDPVVILSHWDSDHWAGACKDTDLQRQTWVAPRQSISTKHTAFANNILKAGGKILIVPSSLSPFAWSGTQSFELRRCTGSTKDRNEYGLALVVEDNNTSRGWLLTGDAAYHFIPSPLPADLAAIIVPHHGADMGKHSVPPPRSPNTYSRLLYSFGPSNRHGRKSIAHPTQAAVDAHVAASWPHGTWTPPPGASVAGTPVLATAAHPSSHLDGAAAGWSAPPSSATHWSSCHKSMPVTQT